MDSVPRDFYVYALYHDDGVTPFYIGKGRNRRWLQHERQCQSEKTPKAEIIRSMLARGLDVPKRKLAEGLTNEEAVALEKRLIAEIGRLHEGGPLTNRVAGGAGNWLPSPETRQKLSEHAKGRSEEHRARLAKAFTGRVIGLETRKKIAEAKTGKALSEDHRAKIGKGNAGKSFSDERRHNISVAVKGSAAVAAARKAGADRQKGRTFSEEHRKKLSEARRRRPPASEETRAKISAAKKGNTVNLGRKPSAETRALMSEAQRLRRAAERGSAPNDDRRCAALSQSGDA